MKTLIKKILREEFEYKQQLFNLLRSGDNDNLEMVKMISQGQGINIIELLIEYFKEDGPPYFKMLNHFDLSDDELIYIFSEIFGEPVTINKMSYGFIIYDENGRNIYYETYRGFWRKSEYDENGNRIYVETSNGYWKKWEYDENGNIIYYENSEGFWEKIEYDKNSNIIYYETSNGYWKKWEYDENGNIIYYENSDGKWAKREYDKYGNIIYYEDSDGEKTY